jgi:hypothetical protein
LPFHIRDHHALDFEFRHGVSGVDVQVVVEVCTGAVVMAMVSSLLYFVDLTHIDIDTSDVEYNYGDSHFYERTPKAPGSASRLAHHAEGLAVDVTVSPAAAT